MDYENRVVVRVFLFLLPFFIIAIRLILVLPSTNSAISSKDGDKSVAFMPDWVRGSNIMIFLGSGGHTGEMMKLLSHMEVSELRRTFVISSNDTTSILKCKEFEDLIQSEFPANFLTVHRARSVGEPMLLSIKNTVMSFVDTLKQLSTLPQLPSVLLLNGPGTSVPLAYMIFMFKVLGLTRTRIIYIESLARVNDLSVSGKMLLPIADRMIVQWPSVASKYKRAEYYGILV